MEKPKEEKPPDTPRVTVYHIGQPSPARIVDALIELCSTPSKAKPAA